jgi:hypothetical protein
MSPWGEGSISGQDPGGSPVGCQARGGVLHDDSNRRLSVPARENLWILKAWRERGVHGTGSLV